MFFAEDRSQENMKFQLRKQHDNATIALKL